MLVKMKAEAAAKNFIAMQPGWLSLCNFFDNAKEKTLCQHQKRNGNDKISLFGIVLVWRRRNRIVPLVSSFGRR